MEDYLTHITTYLLTQSWQIAALVVVVAVINLALRNRSAHVRYLLWLIVLAKCLVPPLLTVPLAVLPQAKPVTVPILERMAAPEAAPVSAPPTPIRPALPIQTIATRPPGLGPRQWFALAWMGGVTVFVLIAVTKALRTQFWLRRKRKSLPAELRAGITDLFFGLGLKKFPKLWLVEGIGQPFVWGLLRGGIYLPTGFARSNNTGHRKGVIGHELNHVLRFDAAVNLLQVMAQAIFWFHPFVWWANKRIRAEREKCCDEMTIARLNAQVKDYSRAIVDTLVTEHESTRPVPSLAIAGPVKNIEERIKTMLRPGKKFYKHPSMPAAAVVILTALLAVPTSVVLTARAETVPIFENPTNLGQIVNSAVEDSGPCISADGLSLYFQSRRPGGFGENDIWVTNRKTKNDPWLTPVNLGPPVNTAASDENPCLSVDGLELYFTSDRPGGSGNLDIFITKRKTKDAPWGPPVNLGPKVNSAMAEIDPSISADGLSLYFSDAIWQESRPGGIGGPDIWMTTRENKDAPWAPAINLGPPINTPAKDVAPSLSMDGLTLYFASNRDRGTDGRPDIWMTARKTKDAPWGPPVSLGPTVNNPSAGEWGPNISSDGSTLYFVSINSVAGPGFGKADLWQVSLHSSRTETAKSLHEAAADGDLEQVKRLIAEGADVNATQGENARTPLIAAAQRGHAEIVKVLLASGAKVDMRDARRLTPLIHAILSRENKEVVKALVAGGADVNQRTGPGLGAAPPLTFAVWRRREATIEVLLEAGADIDAKDRWGYTPLHYAAFPFGGHKEVLTWILSKRDYPETIFIAACKGDLEKVKTLLADGDVNMKDEFGCTLLHWAALADSPQVADFLIAKGADVNARGGAFNLTPLLAAHALPVVELLVSKGADIEAIGTDIHTIYNEPGRTKLHLACSLGDKDMAEFLIGKGAAVDVRGAGNRTPLIQAAARGYVQVVELLIANGADINAKDNKGQTALSLAKEQGRDEIVELLRKHGAKE